MTLLTFSKRTKRVKTNLKKEDYGLKVQNMYSIKKMIKLMFLKKYFFILKATRILSDKK